MQRAPAHRPGPGFTTLPLLPLIRQRTLVLTGDQDPIIPVANGRILAAGILHATLHVYHGGHVEMVTRDYGGYLRGRAKTRVALCNGLPRQLPPASPA